MKDTKFFPLLSLSVLFLLISLVMLGVLGYNVYRQSEDHKELELAKEKLVKSKGHLAVEKTRDTLQKMYAAAVTAFQPDSSIDATIKSTGPAPLSLLDNKLTDYYKLRNEITSLLKDSSSASDLELARFKIKELQVRVDELKNRNVDIENENRRLRAMLSKLTSAGNPGIAGATDGTNQEERSLPAVKPSFEPNTSAVFSASELSFAATDEQDTEVNNAAATEKFSGSVVVRNTLAQGSSEVMLVLIQPDGKILKNAWESGSFETESGKKIYSRKIKFDYNKGESRRLNFNLPLDNCQKGTYTLQLYSRGKVIGKAAKTVS